jgi:hypothetical protein
MAKVDAYNNETGQKQVIPEHWLDSNEPAFKVFTKTPRQKAKEAENKPAKPEAKESI